MVINERPVQDSRRLTAFQGHLRYLAMDSKRRFSALHAPLKVSCSCRKAGDILPFLLLLFLKYCERVLRRSALPLDIPGKAVQNRLPFQALLLFGKIGLGLEGLSKNDSGVNYDRRQVHPPVFIVPKLNPAVWLVRVSGREVKPGAAAFVSMVIFML